MADVQAQRDAAIAKKEEERKKKNEEIKAKKQELQKERERKHKEEGDANAEEQAKKDALAKKREENIANKEKGRQVKAAQKKGGASKYSKKDVFELHAVFREYDADGSGKVSLEEFSKSLKNKKAANAPRPGEKSTLEQRRAQEGLSILDLSESVFHEMDVDGDGDVTFTELVKLMFPYARPDEIATMLEWVAPEPEPEPEPKPELSAEAVKAIKSIFKLYDKDKSGSLTVKELKLALSKTGIDPDDIKQYFADFDEDGSESIDINEFQKLMESTGAFDEM